MARQKEQDPAEAHAPRRWIFGGAILDERRLELTVAGRRVALERRPLLVLLHLLRHGDRVVTKSALHEAVWPGRILTETVLTKCIAKLRRAVGEDVIKTLHGVGYRLNVPIEHQDASEAQAHRPNNLPSPLTSLIGRQASVQAAVELLRDPGVRLVTFTGPGGVGKTRLALQVASELLGAYEHGAFMVDLASITDPEALPSSIAKVLGVREAGAQPLLETLKDQLRQRQLLLVLDNFEQLVAASPLLAELLQGCKRTKALVTSRELLRVRGEHAFEVPALSSPDPSQALAPTSLREYSAVCLFEQRARTIKRDFTIDEHNAAAVAELCRRLDGLPLAIELAAARAKLFSPAEMLARLNRRFELLAEGARDLPGRQQTLWATIDWSHDLLDAAEQALLRRLAVFVGGFTLEAAQAVCGAAPISPGDVFHLLARLVDKSLVRYEDDGRPGRYRLLESVRDYARDRLVETGEAERVRARHLEFFADLAAQAKPHLGFFIADAAMTAWLPRLELEHDNLREALAGRRQSADEAARALQLAMSLHWFWVARGHFREARTLLGQLLASPGNDRERLPALATAGYLACWQGDFAATTDLLGKSLERSRACGDEAWTLFSLNGLGFAYHGLGRAQAALPYLDEAMALARRLDDRWSIAFSAQIIGYIAYAQGRHAEARQHFAESIALITEMGGNKPGIAHAHVWLGRVALAQSDATLAKASLREATRLFREMSDRRGLAYALVGFARLAALQRRAQEAAKLAGAVASLQRSLGLELEAGFESELDQAVGMARAELGPSEYERWSALGGDAVDELIASLA